MKKIVPIVLAGALTGGVVYTVVTLLDGQETNGTTEVEQNIVTGAPNESSTEKKAEPNTEEAVEEEVAMDEPLPNFYIHEQEFGVVEALENENFQLVIENGEEVIYTFVWNPENTKVIDNTGNPVKVEGGESITFTAYTSSRKPTIMIYPPRYTPDVIVVQTEQMGAAEYTKLNEDFLNEAGNVKFNIDDKVVIENLSGEKVEASAIVDKDVIVFYGVTTRSIPAQATPTKILLLDIEQ